MKWPEVDRWYEIHEKLSNVVDFRAVDASIAVKAATRMDAPTGHLCYTNLASLGLLPVTAIRFSCDVTLMMGQRVNKFDAAKSDALQA